MTEISEFLFPAPAHRSLGGIIRWWESRRLHYNLIVGSTGLFSLAAVWVIGSLPPDGNISPPPLQLVLAFGVLANLCYLLGPAVEAAVGTIWGRKILPVGPVLFRIGLTFSVGLTLLPTLLITLNWVYRFVHAIFF